MAYLSNEELLAFDIVFNKSSFSSFILNAYSYKIFPAFVSLKLLESENSVILYSFSKDLIW